MRDGGTWALPGVGLIFNKRGAELVLIARMPHVAEMPIDAEALLRRQETLFQDTVAHFGAAGIPVKSEVAP